MNNSRSCQSIDNSARRRITAKSESGATLVEFALCFGVFIMIIFGTIEIARYQTIRAMAVKTAQVALAKMQRAAPMQADFSKCQSANAAEKDYCENIAVPEFVSARDAIESSAVAMLTSAIIGLPGSGGSAEIVEYSHLYPANSAPLGKKMIAMFRPGDVVKDLETGTNAPYPMPTPAGATTWEAKLTTMEFMVRTKVKVKPVLWWPFLPPVFYIEAAAFGYADLPKTTRVPADMALPLPPGSVTTTTIPTTTTVPTCVDPGCPSGQTFETAPFCSCLVTCTYPDVRCADGTCNVVPASCPMGRDMNDPCKCNTSCQSGTVLCASGSCAAAPNCAIGLEVRDPADQCKCIPSGCILPQVNCGGTCKAAVTPADCGPGQEPDPATLCTCVAKTCPVPQILCADNSCGTDVTPCPARTSPSADKCTCTPCPSGEAYCGGTCKPEPTCTTFEDLSPDGCSCQPKCASGQVFCGGSCKAKATSSSCAPFQPTSDECGCETSCGAGQTMCSSGSCGPDVPCHAYDGLEHTDPADDCSPCKACDPCASNPCGSNYECRDNGSCSPQCFCAAANEPAGQEMSHCPPTCTDFDCQRGGCLPVGCGYVF